MCHGHAPHRARCVSHPSSPMSYVMPVAHAVLCTSLHTPCVVALIAHTVCCGPHRVHCVSRPSSRMLCVMALIACTVCRSPHHVHCVSWPSSRALCVRSDMGFLAFCSHSPWGVEFMMKLIEDNENWCALI